MAEPSPRLYVSATAQSAERLLATALDADTIACVLLCQGTEAGPEAALRQACSALQSRGIAVLGRDDIALAREIGCDGVHLSDPKAYRAARAQFGAEAIVGVGCADSRHDAMTAGEAGADYVAFGSLSPAPALADHETLMGWQLLMTVPCVGLGAQTLDDCAALGRAGADFVMAEDHLWTAAADIHETLRALNAALEDTPVAR